MKKTTLFAISLICFLIDQISKVFVIHFCELGVSNYVIPSFFSITYVKNTGAAWGMFSNGTIILALISMVFLFFAIKYILNKDNISKLSTISYAMIIGGVLGNLLDRLFRNYVVDFLSFNIFSYSFPVFNIADCFIVIGIILVLIESFLENKKVKK